MTIRIFHGIPQDSTALPFYSMPEEIQWPTQWMCHMPGAWRKERLGVILPDVHQLSYSDPQYFWRRQKVPAILISTLLLQTHAPQLYSLVLTRFCWNLESSTLNAWNAKNAIFSHASCVTFGPWITWRSCIAAVPTNPNRTCQLGFDFSVHVVALYAISRPYSVFWLNQYTYLT